MAVVVGNNYGQPGDLPLRFAERDATRVAQTLRELGGWKGSDVALLLGQDAEHVRRALAAAEDGARSRPTLMVVYFSGHADGGALHLGSSRLPWDELKRALEHSSAQLRIALVDACQAGSMMSAKGLSQGPPLAEAAPSPVTGTAILMAAEANERAQEAISLGGSFFTHFLVSALRGAADSDGDRRITLAEAQAYTTKHTLDATSAWAPAVQHPLFEFDISGHGDVVLSDLRESIASLSFAPDLVGQVVVTERGSQLVVVETDKRAGQALELALPAGRYQVHLRKPSAIYVADVGLPWGGHAQLAARDLVPRSYQAVAQKGGVLELHRHRVSVAAALQSPIVSGMGPLGLARIGYGAKLGAFELGLRISTTYAQFPTLDATVRTFILAPALTVAYERPIRRLDLRVSVIGEVQWWRQRDDAHRTGDAPVFGVGIGVGVRIPIWRRLFCEPSVEGMLYLPDLRDRGVTPRPTLTGGFALGVIL